jgi:hypothetical protein
LSIDPRQGGPPALRPQMRNERKSHIDERGHLSSLRTANDFAAHN